jgi:hypothetical protein
MAKFKLERPALSDDMEYILAHPISRMSDDELEAYIANNITDIESSKTVLLELCYIVSVLIKKVSYKSS